MKMTTRTLQRRWPVVTILAALATAPWAAAAETVAPPPNAPATVEWKASTGRLRLRYHGTVILDATVRAEDALKIRWAVRRPASRSNWNNRKPSATRRRSSSG